MKLRTKQQIVDRIFAALLADKDARPEVQRRLADLPQDPTVQQMIDSAPGCAILFRNICEECGQDVVAMVEIGEELNHDSRTTWVCEDCLRAALRLIEKK